MPGPKAASETGCVRLDAPSTITTNCAVDFPARPEGTSTLIWVSLSNRIFAGNPSKLTLTFLPERAVPINVKIDPGTAGPEANVAPFTTPVTFGEGGVVTGAVTTNVIGIVAELLCGSSALIVKTALYVPGCKFAG